MKFIIFLIMIVPLYAAPIDTSLYEGEGILNYYQKIEKDINSSISQQLKSKKTIALERSTLAKLKELYNIKDEIKSFKILDLSQKEISQERYFDALTCIAKLKSEINRLQTKGKDIQQKLFSLKNDIEKTLPNDDNHTLLGNQLQYAFYKISQDKITKSLLLYTKLFHKEFHKFQSALPRVHFQTDSAKKLIQISAKKIDVIHDKNILLTIDKDSEAKRGQKAQKKIFHQEKIIQKETDSALSKKLKAQILLSLKWLKENNQKAFLHTTDTIDHDFETLSPLQKERYNTMLELLMAFGDKHFDTTSVTLASTELGINYIKDSALKIINKTLFVYEEKAFSIKTIITFVSVLIMGFLLASIYKKIVDSFRKTRRIKSLSIARLIANSGYYLIMLSTFFIALQSIGLDMHTIFVVIGAILLWLALGLQGFISNYAMGILIKIDRSIRIGDHIELDKDTVGDVDDMDFRSITIQNSDQVRITIPNSRFIGGSFINHTLEDNCRRIHIAFSADKNIPHQIVQNTILEALQQSSVNHIRDSRKQAQVILTDINRKITRYALYVWVRQQDSHDMPVEKSKFLEIIHKSLRTLQTV